MSNSTNANGSDATFQPWRTFKPEAAEPEIPHGWIQWKGTNVCLDFHCKCGELGHVDADFAYFIQCGACGQIYEMSGYVEARPIDAMPADRGCKPVIAKVDEDEIEEQCLDCGTPGPHLCPASEEP